jgi:adenosylhomocysteine nucleosidase
LEEKAFYRSRFSPSLSPAISQLTEVLPASNTLARPQVEAKQGVSRRKGKADGAPVIAVTGLSLEARIAAGPRVRTLCGGCNVSHLTQSLEASAKEAAAIISFGIAGALAPGIAPGTRLVARAVIASNGARYHGDPAWSEQLAEALGGVPLADIAGVDEPVPGHAEKRALHLKTGALAADTESHIAAGIAAAYRLPFAAVRVVADPAHRQLPHAALVAIKPGGSLALGAIARSVLSNPGQLPLLFAAALDAFAAFNALFRSRKMLTGTFGFGDFEELLLDMPAEDVFGGPLRV